MEICGRDYDFNSKYISFGILYLALNLHHSPFAYGEGNGKPLQCSCLENPRDGGAWWAAVYGVAQSRTRLKRLSSSSSHLHGNLYLLQYLKIQTTKITL